VTRLLSPHPKSSTYLVLSAPTSMPCVFGDPDVNDKPTDHTARGAVQVKSIASVAISRIFCARAANRPRCFQRLSGCYLRTRCVLRNLQSSIASVKTT
jgi:hypothetical protein